MPLSPALQLASLALLTMATARTLLIQTGDIGRQADIMEAKARVESGAAPDYQLGAGTPIGGGRQIGGWGGR